MPTILRLECFKSDEKCVENLHLCVHFVMENEESRKKWEFVRCENHTIAVLIELNSLKWGLFESVKK